MRLAAAPSYQLCIAAHAHDTSALRHALQVLLALCLSLLEFCLLDLLENALHACLHMAATAPLHEMWVALGQPVSLGARRAWIIPSLSQMMCRRCCLHEGLPVGVIVLCITARQHTRRCCMGDTVRPSQFGCSYRAWGLRMEVCFVVKLQVAEWHACRGSLQLWFGCGQHDWLGTADYSSRGCWALSLVFFQVSLLIGVL